MKMLNWASLALFLFAGLFLSAQTTYEIDTWDGQNVTLDCDVTTTLIYGGDVPTTGDGFVVTFCPDIGTLTSINFTPEVGGGFEVSSSSTVSFYDGEDTSAPLIVQYSDDALPGGFSAFTTPENLSGCLTVQFQTNGQDVTQFMGLLTCEIAPQAFTATVFADPEIVEGYIDICQGEGVTFTATTDYPLSGNGYDQSDATSNFIWAFPDGSTQEGLGLTEITATFDDQIGYLIVLTIEDQASPSYNATQEEIKVRVSTTPSFAGVVAQYQDSICLGTTSTLIGGIPETQGVSFGATPTASGFIGGGTFGLPLALPDGNGQAYSTSVNIEDFPEGLLIESVEDLVSICLNIEHSYLGDLEGWITCPNGQELILWDTFNGGNFPGGNGMGGEWLGEPIDLFGDNTEQGVGYDYCFTPEAVLPEWGPTSGFVGGQPAPEGTYQAYGNWDDLIGCPVNGEWSVNIQDNIGSDDGWLLSWSILFSADIDPDAESYIPILTDGFWQDNPNIIANNDTVITVQPDMSGISNYVFTVEDNFGCSYDTTVTLWTADQPLVDVALTEIGCADDDLSSEVIDPNGNWFEDYSYSWEPANLLLSPTTPETTTLNLASDTEFTLTVSPTNLFGCVGTATVTVPASPLPLSANLPELGTTCIGDPLPISAGATGGEGSYFYTWTNDNGDVIGSNPSIIFDTNSNYDGEVSVIVQDDCTQTLAVTDVSVVPCSIDVFPNVITLTSESDDVVNNTLVFEGLQFIPGKGSLTIFNRWGTVVWETQSYNNDWAGTDQQGNYLPAGTYWYELEVAQPLDNLPDKIKTSFITIIR